MPETRDVQPPDQGAGKQNHQGVNYKREQPESKKIYRQRQQNQGRSDQDVYYPQYQSRPEQYRGVIESNIREEQGSKVKTADIYQQL